MKETYNEQSWGRFKELMQKLTKRLAATSIKADLFDDRLTKAEEELDDINDITTGINLLRGTRDFKVGSERGILSNNFYADGFTTVNATSANGALFYKDEQGFTVFKMSRSGMSTASFTPIRTSYIDGLQQGDDITIFMDIKIDDLSQLDNSLLGCLYLTNATSSSLDIRTINHKPLSGEWHSGEWEKLVIHIKISVEPSQVRLALGTAQNGSVHYKCVGVYKGHINDPEWSASPFDVLQKGDAESGNISFPIRLDQGGTGATSLKGAQDALGISSINDYTTGINLIRGTRDFILGTQTSTELSQSRYDGFNNRGKFTFSKGLEGFTVASVAQSGLSSDNPQYLHSSLVRLDDPTEYITISTEFMVDDATAWDSKILFSLVLSGVSSWKNITISDTGVSNIESGVWKRITYRFTPSSYGSNGEWLVLNLLLVRNGSIHFRKTGVYKGKINDPIWSPAPADLSLEPVNDITTGINLARQTRDIIAGTQKLGSYICSDGFYIQGSVIFSKDDQGYGVAYCNAEQRSIWTSNVKGGKAGEWYTFAFEVKFDSVALTDSWNLSNISVRTQDWTTTVQTTSTNVGDLKKRVGTLEAGKWYQVINYILLDADVKDNELFYGYTSISRDLIALGVSYRKAGFYKGRIENPEWSASPFDVLQKGDAESGSISFPIRLDQGGTGATSLKGAQDALGISSINDITTGINLLRGTRDCSQGTQSSGHGDPFYTDGFWNIGSYTKTTDDNGFGVITINRTGVASTSAADFTSSVVYGIKSNTTYTMFFDVKIDSFGDLINAAGDNSFGSFRLMNASANNAVVKATYYRNEIINSVKQQGIWYTIVVSLDTGNLPSDLCFLQSFNRATGNGSISYRKFGIVEGLINNPEWFVSPFDVVSSYDWNNGAPSLLGIRTAIKEGDNIDDYLEAGSYACTSDAIARGLSGLPDGLVAAFILDVGYAIGTNNKGYLTQRIVSRSSSREYLRERASSTTWLPWRQTYANTEVRPIEGGGTGAKTLQEAKDNLGISSINDITTGINLLRGTRDFDSGSTIIANLYRTDGWYADGVWTFSKDEAGYGVANCVKSGETSDRYLGLYGVVVDPIASGETVTLSFEFMIDDIAAYNRPSICSIATYKTNNTSDGASLSIQTGSNFFEKPLESGKWNKCVAKLTTNRDIDGINYFLRVGFFVLQNGGLHIKKVCVQKGNINNPEWNASPFDVASSSVQTSEPLYLGYIDDDHRIIGGDLNNYRTPGVYVCLSSGDANSVANYPFLQRQAFKLIVEYPVGRTSAADFRVRQRAINYYEDCTEYIRFHEPNQSWTSWRQTYANTTVRPLEGGGTGASTGRQGLANLLANGTTLGAVSSLSGVMVAGVDYIDPSTTTDNPGLGYGLVLTLSRKATSDPMAVMVQLAIATNGCAYRTKSGSTPTWSPWYRMTTTAVTSSPGLEGPSVETYPAESLEKDSQIATLENRIKSLEKTLIDNGLMLADDQSL